MSKINMKLSNLRNHVSVHKAFAGDKEYATVDVTTGVIFKKTVPREICRAMHSWFFLDDGMPTPSMQVERLFRAHMANKDRE